MSKTTIELKIEALNALLADNPDDLEALVAYAEYQMRYGSRLEALQAYQHAIAVDKRSFEAHIGLAVVYMNQGLYSDGFSELLSVLKLDFKNIDARVCYEYFAGKYPVKEDLAELYAKIKPYKYSLKEIRTLRAYFDAIIELADFAVADYEKQFKQSSDDLLCEYKRAVALKRRGEFGELRAYICDLEDNILAVLRAEEEARRAEEERLRLEEEARRAEEERLRQEEERRRKEEEIRRKEEELRIAEEERLRLEEEMRRMEEETRRMEEERLRMEEEARRAEEERIRQEEEARRAEEERIRQEEEARRAEEERLRQEALRLLLEKYDSIRPEVCNILNLILKNRGVKSVILLERGGFEIASVASEPVREYSDFASEVVSLIDSHYAGVDSVPLLYAVLEYKGGLIALRILDEKYMFAVIAGSGANFGALKYSMEKNCASILSLLNG